MATEQAKAAHTRGPWRVWDGKGGAMPRIITDAAGSSVADANAGFPCSREEQDANARLIAAAPDLFEASLNLLIALDTEAASKGVGRDGFFGSFRSKLAAALSNAGCESPCIAKATGA